MEFQEKIKEAARIIRENPSGGMAFTGAGISVESGIPPFRGSDGLWSQVDPSFIEIETFRSQPEECWKKIRTLFYDHWGQAKPNSAHVRIAQMLKCGLLAGIVTQNIDCLHQRAGAPEDKVYEFHGTLDSLICVRCSSIYRPDHSLLEQTRPSCPKCGGLLKPDFVFFGEGIPEKAFRKSFELAETCAWCLVIGTSGEVMPACEVPRTAHRNGARVIEINPEPTAFTRGTTDLFLQGKATEVMESLAAELGLGS